MKNLTNKKANPDFTSGVKSTIIPALFDDIDCRGNNSNVLYLSSTVPIGSRPRVVDAISYAKKGWAVFPVHSVIDGKCTCGKDCGAVGKHPLTEHGFNDATTDIAIIGEWWKKWPWANIGIATGDISGIVVLDVDKKNNGYQSLEELIKEHGEPECDAIVETGGGGRHYYFKYPANGQKVPSALAVGKHGGIDVKADGGYVVAPPSIHVSGNQYKWFKYTQLLQAPDWLINGSLRKRNACSKNKPSRNNNWISDTLRDLKEGNRNDSFTRLIGRFYYDRYTEEQTFDILEPHAENCDYPVDELEKQITEIYKRYSNGNYECDRSWTTIEHINDIPDCAEDAFLVENIVPEGHISIIYSEGGHGKTCIGATLALCVACGIDFLGFKTQQKNVLFLDWELSRLIHKKRVREIAKGLGKDLKEIKLNYFYRPLSAAISHEFNRIQKDIEDYNIGLIIIDSLGIAAGVDPVEAVSIIQVFAKMRELGVTIVAIDHQSKLQEQQQYHSKSPFGSAYKFNLARSVLQLVKHKDEKDCISVTIEHKKNNFGYLCPRMNKKIEFSSGCIKIVDDNGPVPHMSTREKILSALKALDKASAKEIADEAQISPKTVSNQLKDLVEAQLIKKIGCRNHSPLYEFVSQIPNTNKGRETGNAEVVDIFTLEDVGKGAI